MYKVIKKNQGIIVTEKNNENIVSFTKTIIFSKGKSYDGYTISDDLCVGKNKEELVETIFKDLPKLEELEVDENTNKLYLDFSKTNVFKTIVRNLDLLVYLGDNGEKMIVREKLK